MVETPQPTRRKPSLLTKKRFDFVEVGLALVFLLIVTILTVGPSDRRALRWLEARHGERNQYSANGEELMIRDFFRDRRGGFFVDVGASHYKDFSNTYYLEHHLGWSGIAIDPLQEFEADYRRHRPGTRFFPFFISDRTGDRVQFFVPADNTPVASVSRDFADGESLGELREMSVKTITLDDLLAREQVRQIDFLSIDVELSEPKVLAGFNVDRFRPALVCIEAHEVVRQPILNYFTAHQYVVIGRYLRIDRSNLYFTPLQLVGAPAQAASRNGREPEGTSE